MAQKPNELQHETMTVPEVEFERPRIVRQDRIYVEKQNCYIVYDKTKLTVINYNVFGVAVRSSSSWIKVGDEIRDAVFFVEETEIAKLHLRCARAEASGDEYSLAFEIIGEPLNMDHVNGAKLAHQVVTNLKQHVLATEQVPERFRAMVYEIRDWLETLEENANAAG